MPQPNWQVRFRDTDGNKLAFYSGVGGERGGLTQIMYTKEENRVGSHAITIRGDLTDMEVFANPVLNYGLDYIIDVRHRPYASPTWIHDYAGFHRTAVWKADGSGNQIFTSYGFDHKQLLARHVIDATVGEAASFKSGPVETVAKEYVNENLGPGAGGRAFTGFSVEGNLARGGSWEGDRSRENVLEVLQELVGVGGGAFDVVRIEVPDTPPQFEFRWYHPQRGIDRTSGTANPAVFSTDIGNMLVPVSSYNRSEEYTVVYVIGDSMVTQRVEDLTRSSDSKWNSIETVRRSTDESTVAGMISVGQDWLDTGRVDQSMSFQVLQSEDLAYGRDYNVGDLMTGIYRQRVDKLFRGVRVNVSGDAFTISVELADVRR